MGRNQNKPYVTQKPKIEKYKRSLQLVKNAEDIRIISKLLKTSVYILNPKSCDHIAANIYKKKRNFSFSAAMRLLRSHKVELFTSDLYKKGYIAVGSPGLSESNNDEDRYIKNEKLSVVFELNKVKSRDEVILFTGWSENDIN